MLRKFVFAVVICGFFALLLFQSLRVLKERFVPANLKAVTEQWITEFLGTPVRVEGIRVGWFRHLSLVGLKIDRTETKFPLLIGVKRVVVRYDLASFLKRNFQIPTKIFLDSPHFIFEAFQRPGALLDMRLLRSEDGLLTRFEFNDGRLELPWFRQGEELLLTGIEGRAIPKKGKTLEIEFQTHLDGVALGALEGRGEFDIVKQAVQFSIDLKDVSFTLESRIPVERLNGTIEVSSGVVELRNIEFLFRGIPCFLNGTSKAVFTEDAEFKFSFRTEGEQFPVEIELHGDLNEESIFGIVRLYNQEYRFQGSLMPRLHGVELREVRINDSYHASGLLDLGAGKYELKVEHEEERARLELVLKGFSGRLSAQLDHFDFFGHDVVTFATLDFAPNEAFPQHGTPNFDLYVDTDYLVFEHQVLRDFHGKARLSAHGLYDILARWGFVSELRGHVFFNEKPEADLEIRMGPLRLGEVQSFGNGSLPRSLEGTLEGTLYVRGFLDEPDLEGAFTIEQGKIGSFEYDRAQIHFSGPLPYLPLSDSKVWKGKHSFALKGGLDFTLRNFLQGVDIINTERVVIWNGIELSQALEDLALASETTVQASALVPSAEGLQGSGRSLGKVGAEYQLGERTSLELAAVGNQSQHDNVRVGPKVKF